MPVNLNREIKAYCPDFGPVRRILRDEGAVFIEAKEQVDRYYHLSELAEGEGNPKAQTPNGGREKRTDLLPGPPGG